MTEPINGLRLSLHPAGLAPRLANLAEWRSHLLHRLSRQIELTADPELLALQREVVAYATVPAVHSPQSYEVFVPLRIQTRVGL